MAYQVTMWEHIFARCNFIRLVVCVCVPLRVLPPTLRNSVHECRSRSIHVRLFIEFFVMNKCTHLKPDCQLDSLDVDAKEFFYERQLWQVYVPFLI